MRTNLSTLLKTGLLVGAIALAGTVSADAKGGHGRGGGPKFKVHKVHKVKLYHPPGWGRGLKVGWRGHHCPPGHWKKGWC